jgi:hypothetical protein
VVREKSKKKFADKNTPRIFAVRFEKSDSSSKILIKRRGKKSSKSGRKIWLNK